MGAYITLTGRVAVDPALREVGENKTQVLEFSIPDNNKDRNGEETTTWYRVAVFGSQAAALASFLAKGHAVTVLGRLTQRAFTDKSGENRTSLEVKANEVIVQTARSESEPKAAAASASGNAGSAAGVAVASYRANAAATGDDIPF